MKIGSREVKVTSQVKLIGGEIDNKQNFKQHIHHMCKWVKNQLNAFIRLKCFKGFQERKLTVKTWFYLTLVIVLLYGSLQYKP